MVGESLKNILPYFATGRVVKGFNRGSRELGCPTANISDDVVNTLPDLLLCGVYYGFGNVDNGPIYPMVTSIGWNPQYNNAKKSLECHLISHVDIDLYDSLFKIVLLGYLRPMTTFSSIDGLKEAIQRDICDAKKLLENPELATYRTHPYFNLGGESRFHMNQPRNGTSSEPTTE